jgi:hypothetical protein
MDAKQRYLSLLRKSLTNELYIENEARIAYLVMCMYENQPGTLDDRIDTFLHVERWQHFELLQRVKANGELMKFQDRGGENPMLRNFFCNAHSMIGMRRMDNLHMCLESITADRVPGDLIETGVWRGGATIYMRGFLAAHGITDRAVWVADSFEGLPKPTLAQDEGQDFSKEVFPYLAVELDEVRALFARYELLDDQVRFLKGWFKDTLPTAPIEQLALLRLDGDLYTSTWDALKHLYHKVAPGGYVIIDDYRSFTGCKDAVDMFRMRHRINDPIVDIDPYAVYWRKS